MREEVELIDEASILDSINLKLNFSNEKEPFMTIYSAYSELPLTALTRLGLFE